jgi:hypothetical protein
MGGTTRNNIAALNLSNGLVITSFNPNVGTSSSAVKALALINNKLYMGGSFSTVGGVARSGLAAVNTSDGSLDNSFNPSLNSLVMGLAISGSTLYVGGGFTTINGITRNRHAKSLGNPRNASHVWDHHPTNDVTEPHQRLVRQSSECAQAHAAIPQHAG